jgi:REP element-mobilizing transposase RayT
MTRYKNKYRIESARCQNWNYTENGYYFVTICTRDRQCCFGDVIDGKMQLSPIGQIVAEEWQKTEQIRSNVQIDAWVVMPNHLHGIVIIHKPVETLRPDTLVETFRRNVFTDKSRLKPNSLGSIIGQFKSVCTKRIWAAGFPDFGWQTRFHDRIIRDEESASQIREYIINNPARWESDKNNLKNISQLKPRSSST